MKIFVSLLLCACVIGLIEAQSGPEVDTPAPKPIKPINGQIIGGDNAIRGNFPWQVALLTPSGDLFCGGSLITVDFVLTAAHCVIGPNSNSTITALLGANTRNVAETGRVSILVSTKLPYNLTSSAVHDIALLKLKTKAPLGTFIKLIRLPSIRDILISQYIGQNAIISGWGINASDSTTATQILQRLNTKVISNIEALLQYTALGALHMAKVTPQKLFVTTEQTKSTCFGDSGGPLVIKEFDGKHTQIGVDNFAARVASLPSCTSGYPAGYSRVTYYLTWIATKIGASNIRLL